MWRRLDQKATEIEERVPPVFTNRSFLLLWSAQLLSQTAQNAILYALLVMAIDLTQSARGSSGVVLTFVIPTVIFGVFSGVLVDRWSKRRLLILTNIGRAVAALAFFFAQDHFWGLIAVNMFFASMSQLFTTANAASIPYVVSRQQLISANSMFSLAFTIAQFAGLLFLSPLILKTAGAGPLFIISGVAFVVATLLTRLLPYLGHDGDEEKEGALPGREELRGAVSEFWKALGALRNDPVSYLAMAHITTSSTLVLLFAILVPRYMQEILDVDPDNAVAIFAPVGVGALIGLRAVPFVVPRLGKTRTVALGLFGLAATLAALGFVQLIADGFERTERLNPFGADPYFGLTILVLLTMAFAGPMGFAYALLNAPAQTLLHERIPVEMRGRVFASQMVLANGISLLPLVVAGGAADLYGVSAVVLAIAAFMFAGGALTLYLERRWLPGEGGPPPRDGGAPESWSRPPETVTGSIDSA
jgi:MFS family permease